MAKKKKRINITKKKKSDLPDDVPEEEEDAPPAKKMAVAASSTSVTEDYTSQSASFTGIVTSEISGGALGSSSHFWCNYCEFSADTKQELITHMRRHMIKCLFCTFSSLSRSEVNRHTKSEHIDEVEVEQASSSTDHDMDKDPCCACVFCDFLTYSTEYLEKHTQVTHRGLLPKSVAKMISKAVSARVRQADAMFYSGFSCEQAEADKEQDSCKSELPSSSNTIVIDEEDSAIERKPIVKDFSKLTSNEENSSAQVSSCLKPDPVDEQADKIINELSRALTSPIPAPSDWKVKVETIYCLSCPYSNVAVDKLKCHTFSRHPGGAAVARNNSGESALTLPDVTFFCVKESCTHSTNTCSIYEEHLMTCCPLRQPLPQMEKERLRSTLKYVMDFTKKHCFKSAPGFFDFVSSFNKIHLPEDSLISQLSDTPSDVKMLTQSVNETISSIQKVRSQEIRNNNLSVIPVVQEQHHHPDNSAPPNVPFLGNHSQTPVVVATESYNVQPQGLISAENKFHGSYHSFSSQNEVGNTRLIDTNLPTLNVGIHQTDFQHTSGPQKSLYNELPSPSVNNTQNSLPSASNNYPVHSSVNLDPNHRVNPSANTVQLNHASLSGNNISNAVTAQLSQVVESGVMGSVGQFNNNIVSVPGNTSMSHQNVAPVLPHNGSFNFGDQNVNDQSNPPFTSSHSDQSVLLSQQSQQQMTGSGANQLSNLSTMPNISHPQKMLDLLSDSYSVLLDDDLDLNSGQSGDKEQLNNILNVGFDAPQSKVSEVHGITNQHIPPSDNLPETPLQNSVGFHGLARTPQNSGMSYSLGSQSHSESSTDFSLVPPQSTVPTQSTVHSGIVSQASMSNIQHSPGSLQIADSFSSVVASSQNFTSPVMSHPGSSKPQHSSMQHANINPMSIPQSSITGGQNIPQSSVTGNQYMPSSSSQFQFPPALSGPSDASSQPLVSGMNASIPSQVQHEHLSNVFDGQTAAISSQAQVQQDQSAVAFRGQNKEASSILVSNNIQSTDLTSHGQKFSVGESTSQSSMPSFLETHNTITLPLQSAQRQQTTNIPNFLVPTSSSDNYVINQNHNDPNCFPNQDVQAGHQTARPMADNMTPMKNQAMNAAAKNVAGNSPLSPSIYLNGQAPRHNRSNWTNADMLPRGSALPQIRHRASAPVNYPRPNNVRQNLFPPMSYRGRGRPRGPRIPNRFGQPVMNPQDDDVIVTAVVRGPPPKQPSARPVFRRGLMRGQRLPSPHNSGRGMVRNLLNSPSPSQTKKPFDVSRHFVDLACVVNSTNEDDNQNDGDDDIQIMGTTPGQNVPKGPPKVVDAKKFSFCCVHCGKDQGSKQVLKQHMKANHNDSLLGALRNVESGQLLFFCPQLKCEFMTYDENRLTDHLFACYNLDQSKQLPFDLHSALKNLRSLKIRKINTNIPTGGSHHNPIDLDGKGLRDTFNNNLTDAFDEMVENTVGRNMARPAGHTQLSSGSPSSYAQARPPRLFSPQRGRPMLSNFRMPRTPQIQPRQPRMPQGLSNQRGNPRMPPYQPSYTRTYHPVGRRNFRQPVPLGVMRPMRDGNAPQMPRSAVKGRPPGPRLFAPPPTLGNEEQPILIDIEPETTELTQSSQNPALSVNSSSLHSINPATMSHQFSGNNPVDSSLLSSSIQDTRANVPDEQSSSESFQNREIIEQSLNPDITSCPGTREDSTNQSNTSIPETIDHSTNQNINSDLETMEHSTNQNAAPNPEAMELSANQNTTAYLEAEEIPQQDNNPATPQLDASTERYTPAVSTQNDSSTSDQFVSNLKPNSHNISMESELSAAENEEEQVNAILLRKVFAKVPHMPKKLSQRLVLRFKEFAAKSGVVITPNSKVIDEFVERISYKGSNPMSKQQQNQQPQQQYQQQPHQQYQQLQPEQQQQNQYQHLQQHNNSATVEHSQTLRSNTTSASCSYPWRLSSETSSVSNNSLSLSNSQSGTVQSVTVQNPDEVNDSHNQNQSDVSWNQKDNASHNLAKTNNPQSQHENLGKGNTSAVLNSTEESSDIIETKVILGERDLKLSGIFADLAKSAIDQGKISKNPKFGKSSSPSSSDSPPSANVMPSTSNNTTGKNSSDSFPLRTSPPVLDTSANANNYGTSTVSLSEQDSISGESLKSELPVTFPSTKKGESILVQSDADHLVSDNAILKATSLPVLESTVAEAHRYGTSTVSLTEQVSINEKILKKELLPMTVPSTDEGESILVNSSVDHLVSGYAGLEVDIAGKPLPSNNFFPEFTKNMGITKAEKVEEDVDNDANVKIKPVSVVDKQSGNLKIQEPIVDKQSGKLVMKIKKGDIPRKRHDLCSNVVVVSKTHDTCVAETEHSDEHIIRRSERKRKIRQHEVEEDAVDEMDELMSDDDDEYHVESDDESYDESDNEKGHSNKKRSKPPIDPNAFDIKQKGSFNCWICYRKFTSSLSVKKHILKMHSKAFCALSQENCEELSLQPQFSLLLFCPKNCKYVTLKLDAFTQHIAMCQKSGIDSEGLDFVDIQNSFITKEYVELQQFIATGDIIDMMNKQKLLRVRKKKKQKEILNTSVTTVSQNEDVSSETNTVL